MSVPPTTTPTLAVWKFASCDGCQLTLLDCEDELLALSEVMQIAHFLELSDTVVDGPYDVSLVEGSISTAADRERIRAVRARSRVLVTIGACATAGGIQALRNFADVEDFLAAVYARPEYIDTLATSTAIAAHVPVDFELRGCPIDRRQLLEVITAFLAGRRPNIPTTSVCSDCKRSGLTCVMVADGDAVPRAGDALRLRCPVSRRVARMLWVLRAHRGPESCRAARVVAPLRHGRGRARPRVRDVQRGGLPRQGRWRR